MNQFSLLCLLSFAAVSSQAQKKSAVPEIGVVQHIENDSLLNAFGYTCLIENTAKLFSPRNVSEQQFMEHLQAIKKLQVPLLATNIFIPGDLKVVGPGVDEKSILSYVDVVFQRAQAAGLQMIIWGSGGSRGVPDGFDRAKAKEQFIGIAKKIADLASKYDIILALESLNSTEANFINTVKEALEIVKAVDRKNLRLCVDIYHMLKEDELPDIIVETKKYIAYCELAEEDGRTPPGVRGEDFRPYLSALKKAGYRGKVVIECRWEDFSLQGSKAYQEIKKQIDDVYLK